ncbi:UDP-N-acetylglucosamine 2-epimerase [Salinispira pacifica]|uniref:UDP-N-acetylglucosamine 2-epimerase n=1 Tax=Salinispira pacifica TaxID=1307761 RepID=V5WLJ0_9SPIO|nr:UDP-N-acetylglucosamine 2-epimerase [Salinispira pacifica]AHC16489.1 UDP-N-acetylglucosamine 2-epimerase [Salinispira pacifica]
MKAICFVTATRAEYGLLFPLIQKFKSSGMFRIQGIITGAHLSPEFGYTKGEIQADLFDESEDVEILLSSDSPVGVTKAMGLGMISFGEVLARFNPDLLVLLGDRYEMLSVASAALVHKIPIAHLHGGEITEGAYDDSIRHAITKLSHLHFTATEQYRRRVIQMGEQPNSVFNVGAIGIDNIKNLHLLSRQSLFSDLGIPSNTKVAVVTYHPVTLNSQAVEHQIRELLAGLQARDDLFIVFTKANADNEGRKINKALQKYVSEHTDTTALFDSLGVLRYLSLVKAADVVIGNSSSGILEAPALATPVINIGDRQKGRTRPEGVIDCSCQKSDIIQAIDTALSAEFAQVFTSSSNPYGDGKTSENIFSIISEIRSFSDLVQKKFYPISISEDN